MHLVTLNDCHMPMPALPMRCRPRATCRNAWLLALSCVITRSPARLWGPRSATKPADQRHDDVSVILMPLISTGSYCTALWYRQAA